jgi:2-isopropylmalate synthase
MPDAPETDMSAESKQEGGRGNAPPPVQLLDATIREGQQHGLVRFSPEQALELARQLDAFRVDIMEVGHPVSSRQNAETARNICDAGLATETLAHARATCKDVAGAAEVGADWVGVFSSVNDNAVKYKMHRSREQIFQVLREAVSEAKKNGLKVRFTCEDASRTPDDILVAAYGEALDAGADRVSFGETVGIMRPGEMYRRVKALTDRFGRVVHAHCHNDFGLATANALAAYEAGAICLDGTIDGIGERSGVAPLAELACALVRLYGVDGGWDLSRLTGLSAALNDMFQRGEMDTRPLVGHYAFAHKSSLHIAAEIAAEASYEPLSPADVGQTRRFILSKLIGRSSLAQVAELAGMEVKNEEIDWIVQLLKSCVSPTEMVLPRNSKHD